MGGGGGWGVVVDGGWWTGGEVVGPLPAHHTSIIPSLSKAVTVAVRHNIHTHHLW